MKIFKRISIIFVALISLLSINVFAKYDVADKNSIEDPIYNLKRQDVKSGTLTDIKEYISKYEVTGEEAIGIDVSSWQGEIDWGKVANSGVKFAIIRAGYRTTVTGNLYEDANARKNIEGAINNGIYVGVYCYSTALNESEALEEAEMTLNVIRGYDIKYFVAYDFENFKAEGLRTDNLSKEQMNKNARVFLNKIKENGYTPCMYGSSYPLRDNWNMNDFADCAVWVAHYNIDRPSYQGIYNMWQLSSNGAVDGIVGEVDIDVDYTYFFKYNHIDISSYMFNSKFYADANPDLKNAFGYDEIALRNHFEIFGKYEGRFATPIFNPRYYLDKYQDLKNAFGNNYFEAYNHFIICGAKEGRQGSKYISSKVYLKNYLDLRRTFYSSTTKALEHYFLFGINEGRVASDEFDVKQYKDNLSSYYKRQLGNNYLKYIALDHGGMPYSDNNIDISSYIFNARFYADKYVDLKNAFGYNEDALRNHFEQFGKREGRQGSVIFDPIYYVNEYADLKKAFGNNYVELYNHFIAFGSVEGRNGSNELNVKKYIKNYCDLESAFGTYYTKAIEHFAIFGYNEGRSGI